MENRDNQNQGREDDLSKAQNQQQPTAQQGQQPPQSAQHPFGKEGQAGEMFGQQQQPAGQSQQQPSGQADYGSAGPSDTIAEQRQDIEGGTATGQADSSQGASFVGSNSASDESSKLVEEDDESTDFSRDGQGAPE